MSQPPLRVLHFSKYDSKGGAAIAAFNSVAAQRRIGIDAHLYCGISGRHEDFVHAPAGRARRAAMLGQFALERLPGRALHREVRDSVSIGVGGVRAGRIVQRMNPDVVVLHNIDGLVPLRTLARFGRPIVWRMHDMWAITPIFHYAEDFPRPGGSGKRPERALEKWTFARKKRHYGRVPDLTLCPPSHWLADCVRESELLGGRPVAVVPNGVDTGLFVPADRAEARRRLGLEERRYVLFGSDPRANPDRKGLDLLFQALASVAGEFEEAGAELLLLRPPPEGMTPPVPHSILDPVTDRQRMADLFAAADVSVAPSRLENLSLAVLESLSSGTPVVAFDIGGMPDMLSAPGTGALVKPFDTGAFGRAVMDELGREDGARANARAACRRQAVDNFSFEAEARQFEALLREVAAGERQE